MLVMDNLQLSKDNNDIGIRILVVPVGQHWHLDAAAGVGLGLLDVANFHVHDSLICLIFLDARI